MIKELHLKNFKCFDDIKIDRLKTLNVIAGKNNYGKTTILDAIFAFYGVRNPGVLLNIKGFRKDNQLLKGKGKPFWLDYFKDLDPSVTMTISVREGNTEVTQEYTTIKKQDKNSKDISIDLNSIISDNGQQQQTMELDNLSSELRVKMYKTETKEKRNKTDILTITASIKNNNITGRMEEKQKDGEAHQLKVVTIITTSRKINKETTLENVSSIITKKRKQDLIESLKVIDDRITNIEIIASGTEKDIYIDVGLNEMTEISMLGEGVSRALAFISLSMERKNAIILIDEVENGIHHSIIKDILKTMLSSAKNNGNQLFITTHSNDVINAINSMNEEKEDITYIRVGRDKKTSIPTISRYDMDDFCYSVDNNWEVR